MNLGVSNVDQTLLATFGIMALGTRRKISSAIDVYLTTGEKLGSDGTSSKPMRVAGVKKETISVFGD